MGLYADLQGVTDPPTRRQIVKGYLAALTNLDGTQWARVRYTGSGSVTDTGRTVATTEWGTPTGVSGNQITVAWDAGGTSTVVAGDVTRWVLTLVDGLNFDTARNLFWAVVTLTRNGTDVTASFDRTVAGRIDHLNPLEWAPLERFPVLDLDPAGAISITRTLANGSQVTSRYNDDVRARVLWLIRTAIRDRTGI